MNLRVFRLVKGRTRRRLQKNMDSIRKTGGNTFGILKAKTFKVESNVPTELSAKVAGNFRRNRRRYPRRDGEAGTAYQVGVNN